MTRMLFASLLLTSALAARASTLFPRQASSTPSLESAYGAIETFSNEVVEKIAAGECNQDDQCNGWLQNALSCAGGGDKDDEALAKCACEDSFQKNFASCVTCVGSDSAKQTGEALTSVCSSLGNGASDSASASQTSSGTAASSSATSSGTATSPSSSSTSSSGTNTASGGNAAAPTESAGSGVDKLGMSQWTVFGMVGTGIVAGLYV